MGLKINVGKSKLLAVKRNQKGSCENVKVCGEEIQEVDKYGYWYGGGSDSLAA